MNIIKDTVNKLTTSLEAFATSVRSLEETVEDLLLIYEEASQKEQADALRLTKGLQLYTIQSAVAFNIGITVDDMKSASRKREFTTGRQIAMLLCRDLLDNKEYTLNRIGKAFGGRDHSTVIYSCETALDLIDTDPIFKRTYFEIKNKITWREPENNTTFEQSSI